ncbi:helix-turn-helix domain-containing protein [Streptomyces iconiensis]|uniref:Helix-turn-helix transcriptional regulator n=1 Tax=Streptomyces iconiensis TaxID=1384038 RepID=A0ABT6ZR69_9ACTN|nr:helix-turn-helix transcriptional regulator [Streptomyces iconiensis]MDJ1131556.1 helix-turn-helix transcriptional regulator [Streptomyces iconiensis]
MARPPQLDPHASLAAALGATVRSLRELRDWTREELADRLYVSTTRIIQIELATDPPNEALAQDLDRTLEADGEVETAWLRMNRHNHPAWALPYLDLERRATRVRKYAAQLVPGILQTPDYAYTLLRYADPAATEETLRRRVDARMSRRGVLEGSSPPHLWVILDETLLMRPFGDDPAIMRDQLGHLLVMSGRPHVELQVLPLESGSHGLMDGSCSLLTFPEEPPAAFLGGPGTGTLLHDAPAVAHYDVCYDHLLVKSLPAEESRDLIHTTLRERYNCPPSSNEG